ncbi:hypothetical protein D3C83_218670 [compost metagenome]
MSVQVESAQPPTRYTFPLTTAVPAADRAAGLVTPDRVLQLWVTGSKTSTVVTGAPLGLHPPST